MDNTMFGKFIVGQDEVLTVVMQKIDDNANRLAFVVDGQDRLCGVASDGDIRRWILKGGSVTARISDVMNTDPIHTLVGDEENAKHLLVQNKLGAIPVLDEDGHIVDMILSNDQHVAEKKQNTILRDVTVVIMAGGKGVRLYPYTKILPKPLIPIGEIPIVERVINAFCDYGIRDFLMTVNYKKNMIQSYFAEIEKGYSIEYVEENKPLGTAGSIKLIHRVMAEPFFVANCDSLIRTDYVKLYQHHVEMENAITIVTALKNDTIPYGVVYSKKDGTLERMVEKPTRSYFINTGMYIINPQVVDLIPCDSFFHMTHLVDSAIKQGYRVGVYPVSEDSFLDMGEIAEMRRMEEKLNIQFDEQE